MTIYRRGDSLVCTSDVRPRAITYGKQTGHMGVYECKDIKRRIGKEQGGGRMTQRKQRRRRPNEFILRRSLARSVGVSPPPPPPPTSDVVGGARAERKAVSQSRGVILSGTEETTTPTTERDWCWLAKKRDVFLLSVDFARSAPISGDISTTNTRNAQLEWMQILKYYENISLKFLYVLFWETERMRCSVENRKKKLESKNRNGV